MQSAPDAFKRYLANKAKNPIYLVQWGYINPSDASNSIPVMRYSSGTVKNPLGPYKNIMQTPRQNGQQITVFEGTSSIGSFEFSLLDKSQEVTKLLFYLPMQNRQVTIKMGFVDIPEESYLTVYTGTIFSYVLESDNLSWKFTIQDKQRAYREKIVSASSVLMDILYSFQTIYAPVADAGKFAYGASGTFAGGNTFNAQQPEYSAYIKIDDEIIGYNADTLTLYPFWFLQRGMFGTAIVDHHIGAPVSQFIVLEDNPINIVLKLLMSTGNARPVTYPPFPGSNGKYDIYPINAGLAIPNGEIDIASFERQRDYWLSKVKMKFYLDGSENLIGKDFIEKEIYKIINAYPAITNFGLISAKIYTPPLAKENSPVLNDDNMQEPPTWAGTLFDKYFFNEIDLKLDWDQPTQKFLTRIFYERVDSQIKYAQVKTLILESKGLRTIETGLTNIQRIADRIFKRFAFPTPVLQIKAFLSNLLLELSDVVFVQSNKIPDISSGTLGFSGAFMELIQRDVDYENGVIQMKALNVQNSYFNRYGNISPSTQSPIFFPVYTLAFPAQRVYAFISKKIDNQTGAMSNGDNGYYITP